MVTGIIIAAAVVGILGILIGVFLGIASEKFKVEVDEKEILVATSCPATTAVAAGTPQAVTHWQKGNRSRPRRTWRMSCGRRFRRKIRPSWALRAEPPRER